MASFFDLLTTKQAFLDAGGNPLSGGRLWTKVSGSNTNKTTFRDADGAVANTNPIILDSRGELPFGIFGSTGPYRLILTTPGDLGDPPAAPIWGPRDNVSGINDFVPASSTEWTPSGFTPTFISSTSFSVPGDQTAVFQPRRRCRATVTGGNRFTTIQSSVFSAGITTVVLVLDTIGSGLDSSISSVSIGIISSISTSQPHDSVRGLDVPSAGTLSLPANADRFNITGTTTISAIANSWLGRRVFLTHSGAHTLTHGVNFVLPGSVSFTVAVGDESVWEQTTGTPTWKMINYSPAASIRSLRVLDKEVGNIDVVNTTSETVIASFSIPGGVIGSNGVVTWRVRGNYLNNSGANNTATIRIKFGGTTIWQDGVVFGTDPDLGAFLLDFSIANLGLTNAQSGGGLISFSAPIVPAVGLGDFSGNFVFNAIGAPIGTASDLAIDTTIARTFEITFQWSVAHANSQFARKFADLTLY